MIACLAFVDPDDGVDLFLKRFGMRQPHTVPANAVGRLGVVRLK
jgi:hypothetical protein